MTQEEFRKMQLDSYKTEADNHVDRAISVLQGAIRELESYKRWEDKDAMLSAVIHYTSSNILGNLRMDLMAACMANIATNEK